jgi:hypothetical protein
MDLLLLFFSGFAAFSFSTVAGGGGAMIVLPLVQFLYGGKMAVPLVQAGNFLGRPSRLILFWSHIDWQVVRWYFPFALLGGITGAWLFAQMEAALLPLILGLFLLLACIYSLLKKTKPSFKMPLKAFSLVGFLVANLSTVVGATGPVLNPFYLNYAMKKEALVATKAMNSFLLAMVQLPAYAFFGDLSKDMIVPALSLGLGAAAGNFLGKSLLKRLSEQRFRLIFVVMMGVFGVMMIWRYLKG